jgi:hypothetical protein
VIGRDAEQLGELGVIQARVREVARRVGSHAGGLPPGLGEQSRQGIRLRVDAARG